MEPKTDFSGMLELIAQPGFLVNENQITQLNSRAQALLLSAGTDIRSLLLTGLEEYADFTDGCLYLKLALPGNDRGAVVVKAGDGNLFLLDSDGNDDALRALGLAARELRDLLTGLTISTDRLIAREENREYAGVMNRSLHQVLRLVGNMSDAGSSHTHQETQNLAALFGEVFDKAQTLVSQAGLTLHYQGLSEEVLGLADSQQLERAVFNCLSNAIKFTPRGGHIHAALTRRRNLLRLSITDSGSGIAESIRSSLFCRYLRQPAIEDPRQGLGLGMVLIRSAAASHGGTVLIDHPKGCGTRITLTLAIRQSADAILRSSILRVDYAGERDHSLLELSDCLPPSLYETE